MSTILSQGFTPPGGLTARYYGVPGGSTTWTYFVQAVYPFGRSLLAGLISVGSAPAALSVSNFIVLGWNPMSGAIGYNLYRNSGSTTVPTINATLVYSGTFAGYTDAGLNSTTAQKVIYDGVRVCRARYDFAVDGDPLAPGLITLAQSDILPAGAVVTNGTISGTTAVTGTGATIAIGTSAGSAANSIKTATAITSFSANAIQSWTGTKFRMSADGTVTITSATAALTAGVFDILLEYVMAIG